MTPEIENEQLRTRLAEMAAEVERLQSVIDEANAQGPLKWALDHFALGVGSTLFDSEKDAVDFSTNLAGSSRAIPLYARPIPAQQSPAAAVPDSVYCSNETTLKPDVKKHLESLIALRKEMQGEESRAQFHAWADEQGFFMDEVWSSVGEQFEDEDTQLAWLIWQASRAVLGAQSPRITEQEPVLDKSARVNATNFMAGVPARMVVEAAQRYYEYRQENPPEKDSELQQKFFAAIDSIKKPVISQDQLLEIAISAISSVQSFSGLASPHAQRWLEEDGRAILDKLNGEKS